MEPLRNIKKINIQSSCRTCLTNLNELQDHHNIFTIPDLGKKFTVCTSLPVEPDDGYPTSLCEQCHTKIDDFYSFQQMCISSRNQFQDHINSEEKLRKSQLGVDSNNLSPFLLKDLKEEKEDNSFFNDESLEFFKAELKNVKSPYNSSSPDEEELNSDKTIIKFEICDDNSINDYSHLNESEYLNEDIKSGDNTTKILPDTVIDYDCKICRKTFKKEATFQAHMREHAGLKPFPCHICDKAYARRNRLKMHIQSNHEAVPTLKFPCTEPGCDRVMRSKQFLRKHIKDIHYANEPKTKQPYICEECGKVLTSLATLKNHRYLHTGEQFPHECPQCHKRYITKNKLKEHLNRHAGIKNYICPHCGARKSTRTELNTHINYHTKEKTYPCQFCDSVFNSLGSCSRHKRIVHEGIKDNPCSYCDKSFGKADTRKHHEMTHTGEKPHECNICHKKFIQPVALKKHKKIHLKAMSRQQEK